MMRKNMFLIVVLTFVGCWMIISCSVSRPVVSSVTAPVGNEIPVTVSFSHPSLDLSVGDTATLSLVVSHATVASDVKWSSSNTSVTTVDNDGRVTAVSVGTSLVTAAIGDINVSCVVSIKGDGVPVTGAFSHHLPVR